MKQEENTKKTKKLSGFYAALCCCVLVIGLAGYFTEKRTTEDSQPVINNETAEVTEPPAISRDDLNISFPSVEQEQSEETEQVPTNEEAEETTLTEQSEEVMEYAVDNPDTSLDAVTVSSEQPAFIMPVNGQILEQYSEVPEYNNPLGDWRVHGGIDIEAEKGCSVSAAAAGVVDKIYENEMGKCVEISHAGGFVTRYMGLEAIENITEGNDVQSGEVIGTSGACSGENVTTPHLHFEMEKKDKIVNPSDFLPSE